jgi:hypothetical protein
VKFAAAAPAWLLVDAETGMATGAPGSYRAASGQLARRRADDPTQRGVQRLAPAHAARA